MSTKMRKENVIADVHSSEVANYKADGWIIEGGSTTNADSDDTDDSQGESTGDDDGIEPAIEGADGVSEAEEGQEEATEDTSEEEAEPFEMMYEWIRDNEPSKKPTKAMIKKELGITVSGDDITKAYAMHQGEKDKL